MRKNLPLKSVRLGQAAKFGGLVATTATLLILGQGLHSSVRASLQDSPKAIVDEVWQLVNQNYVDGSFNQQDWQATRRQLLSRHYTSREQAYNALRVALAQLNDPYTRFMDPEEYQTLTTQTSGELSGIGVQLAQDEVTQFLKIVEPISGSPAAKAGISPGDQLLAIDGRSTEKMSVEQASALIRGKVGTKIKLDLLRNNQEKLNITLTRALVELPTVKSELRQEQGHRIGYIRLGEFSSHAASQTQQAIQSLQAQQVEGYVLDLRGNPGGLLNSSIEIARMWIDQGLIVRTVDRQGKHDKISADDSALTELPMVVLVDGNSASSSEILTGALQDNHRATVVGTTTFGKALVQSVHELSDGSGLAVTIAHYYTPSGTDISHKGITPDIAVKLTGDQQKALVENRELVGTDADPQYARAVKSLTEKLVAASPLKTSPVNAAQHVERKPLVRR